MRDMGVVELALAYAARACSGLTLRGTKLPFIVHPAESLSIAASLTQDSEVLAAAVLKSMPGHTAPEDLKEIFSPRIAALVKEATADKGEDATAENWVERKTLALQLLQRGSRECMILVLANRLSDLRTMAALHAREGAGMWSILNRKDPRAQEWYYSTLLQVLRPLADTEAYRELQCRYTAVFGGD